VAEAIARVGAAPKLRAVGEAIAVRVSPPRVEPVLVLATIREAVVVWIPSARLVLRREMMPTLPAIGQPIVVAIRSRRGGGGGKTREKGQRHGKCPLHEQLLGWSCGRVSNAGRAPRTMFIDIQPRLTTRVRPRLEPSSAWVIVVLTRAAVDWTSVRCADPRTVDPLPGVRRRPLAAASLATGSLPHGL
jgi:hypothetical protein